MARRRPHGARRKLTTSERMLAVAGPNPADLLRRGFSPRQALALERAWLRWDRDHGFAYRIAAGIPTPADRERLDAGDEPEDPEPPEPPGFDIA
jgi:hypothetical protein